MKSIGVGRKESFPFVSLNWDSNDALIGFGDNRADKCVSGEQQSDQDWNLCITIKGHFYYFMLRNGARPMSSPSLLGAAQIKKNGARPYFLEEWARIFVT